MTTSPAPVRAFLSHSSYDKVFVHQVFNDLGATLAELDQVTFEPAQFNQAAILNAMDRCSVFVLFASEHSVKSEWVAAEIREAISRHRDRRLAQIVVYCADKATFKILQPELKAWNIVRVEQTPLICARQIRGILAEVFAERTRTDVFISRDENLGELKRLVIDPSRTIATVAISGFERLGRRSLVRRFCKDVYPAFNVPRQSIIVDVTSSPDDIFRSFWLYNTEISSRTF